MTFRIQVEDLAGNVLGVTEFTGGDITIGRSDDCEIALHSSSVSRRHARFFVHLGRCYVEDLKSANGIVVNGSRINGIQALNGPTAIVVGDHIVRFLPSAQAPSITGPGGIPATFTGHQSWQPALVRLDAREGGLALPLAIGVTRIGRSSSADVKVIDNSVSRDHAEIQRHGATLHLRDVGSANGTRLNGVPVTDPVPLSDGDVVQIGDIPMLLALSAQRASQWRTARVPGATGTGGSRPPRTTTIAVAVALTVALVLALAGLGLAAMKRGTAAELGELLTRAGQATTRGEWSVATESYERALALDPTSDEILGALVTVRREAAAVAALDGCDARLQAARRMQGLSELQPAIDALEETLRCLESVDGATRAHAAAAERATAEVLPPLFDLHRSAGADSALRRQFDAAARHLSEAARLHQVRTASAENGELTSAAADLRSAYLTAADAAYGAEAWGHASTFLGSAHRIEPLDERGAARLARAQSLTAQSP